MAAAPTETDIAIVQLVFFIPALFLSVWLWIRYGFRVGAGAWRLVLVLALLRIIAGSCALAAEKNPSTELYATVLSCDLVGTAPLFLLTLRLVERVNNTYNRIPALVFRCADIFSLTGLALGIAGANLALTSFGSGQPFRVNAYMNAAMALFIAVIAINVFSTAVLFLTITSGKAPRQHSGSSSSNAKHGYARSNSTDVERNADSTGADLAQQQQQQQQSEISAARRIVVGVACAIPFLIVRVSYAAIGDFRNDISFIPYLGDDSVYLGMSVIMEIIAAYICIAVGFSVPPPPPKKVEESKKDSEGSEEKRGLFGWRR